MKINRFTSLLVGAALAASANAADYSVSPAQGWVSSIESFTISFTDEVTVSKSDIASVSYNIGQTGENFDVNKGMSAEANGNDMTITFTRGALTEGKTKPFASMGTGSQKLLAGDVIITIPGDSYTVGGQPGEDLAITYYVANDAPQVSFDYSVTPEQGWVKSLEGFTVVFGSPVEVTEAATKVSYNIGQTGETLDCTAGMTTVGEGNMINVLFDRGPVNVGKAKPFKSMLAGSATVREGDMIFVIPEGTYTVGGQPGPEITLTYFISDNGPVVLYDPIFTPASGSTLSALDFSNMIGISFGEGNKVAWTNNYSSVYLSLNGKQLDTNLAVAFAPDNTTLYVYPDPAVTAPGTYTLTVPADAYTVNGNPNQDITATYTIEATSTDFDYSVWPPVDRWQSSYQGSQLYFDGEVTINPDMNKQVAFNYDGLLYTNNMFANEYFRANGNCLEFASNSPRTTGWSPYGSSYGDFKGGELTLTIKEGSYLVNGVPGGEITLTYYVTEDYPSFFDNDVQIDNNEVLSSFTMEFFDDNVAIDLINAEGCYVQTFEGENVAKVTLSLDNEFTVRGVVEPAVAVAGDYGIFINGDNFKINGLWFDGCAISTHVDGGEVPPMDPITVTPAQGNVDKVDGLQNFDITFNEANPYSISWNVPVLYVNGIAQENAPVRFVKEGNTLSINYEELFTEVGSYMLYLPAGSYMLNGDFGETLTFMWEVIDDVHVEAAIAENEKVTVYDIQGRLILKDANREELRSLKGMYIVNGKKYMII